MKERENENAWGGDWLGNGEKSVFGGEKKVGDEKGASGGTAVPRASSGKWTKAVWPRGMRGRAVGKKQRQPPLCLSPFAIHPLDASLQPIPFCVRAALPPPSSAATHTHKVVWTGQAVDRDPEHRWEEEGKEQGIKRDSSE